MPRARLLDEKPDSRGRFEMWRTTGSMRMTAPRVNVQLPRRRRSRVLELACSRSKSATFEKPQRSMATSLPLFRRGIVSTQTLVRFKDAAALGSSFSSVAADPCSRPADDATCMKTARAAELMSDNADDVDLNEAIRSHRIRKALRER